MTSADLSAGHRPIDGRQSPDHRPIAKTPKLSADGKKYNKVVIIYFLSADEKELKSGILSADKSTDCRPTVGGVNVIAVMVSNYLKHQTSCTTTEDD